jgi:DNA-binding CsgD family transcriptional regulator
MKLTKRVFTYLYKTKQLSILEIVKLSNVNISSVGRLIKKYELESNSYESLEIDRKRTIKKLIKKGYINRQIADRMKISEKVVSHIILKYKLNTLFNKKYEFTDLQKQILIGTFLGDSTVPKTAICITFQHSVKQREYVKHKLSYFNNIPTTFTDNKSNLNKQTNVYYQTCSGTIKHPKSYFKWLRSFYNPTKEITQELLKDFTAASLAFMYMDDGNLKKSHGAYTIASCAFSKQSLELFINHCKNKFDIEFRIHAKNILYLPVKYKEQFKQLILPYIPSTMMYKIH